MGETTSLVGHDDASLEERLVQDPSVTATANNTTTTNQRLLSVQDKDVVISCPCRSRRRRHLRLNHNVFLNFALMITYGISEGLWGGAVYAAYLKQLYGGKNAPIGKIEAIYSIAELVFAVPIGYIADTYGRSKIIRAGSLLFLLTAIFHAVTTYWISEHDNGTVQTTVVLMIIMALWGIGSGIVDGPCEALFADSTPAGHRTHYYTSLEIFYLLATVLGPLLSLVVFAGYPGEDQWNMKALVIIIYAGLAMEGVTAIIMMFFDDDKALEQNDDSESESESSSEEYEEAQETEESEEEDEFDQAGGVELPAESSPQDTTIPTTIREKYQWAIPYILLVSQLMAAAAIGLSDAYFPLFLKDDCGMSPVQVQILYGVEPLFIAAMTWLAARTSQWYGRIQTILLFNAAAIGFFAAIPIFNIRHNLWLLVLLRIFSSSFGDSFHPLEEALLADSLPRGQRARWMSLSSSLSGLHQSATAILGGYLSDYWGYRGTFLATCVGEAIALGMFALLLPLVPARERSLVITAAVPHQSRFQSSPGRRQSHSQLSIPFPASVMALAEEEEQEALLTSAAEDNNSEEEEEETEEEDAEVQAS